MLTDEEKTIYQWQTWVSGFGEAGQERLRRSSVLVSRVGGVGGLVAVQLAAAGIGQLVLAHAGNLKLTDLNRQILGKYEHVGQPRIQHFAERLRELNPKVHVVPVSENMSDDNAGRWVAMADLLVDCAPLFSERFALNRQGVSQQKPMVDCAMYDLEAQITTIQPGVTPCLRCLYPEEPSTWKREFPVFGAVAGTIGCLAAMEAIKVLAGFGEPLHGRLLRLDLRDMTCQTFKVQRNPKCSVCGVLNVNAAQ
jgi:molybdopterin/thiamine biosynthesis adenylyltransferase